MLVLLTAACLACGHRRVPAVRPQAASSFDSSYMDLAAGGKLRIVVPVKKSGNLIGYEISYYAIEARRHTRVQLRFDSAQITKDDATAPDENAPELPFPLPAGPQHVRLIYYIRHSEADHNMAIAAARDLVALDSFTIRLKLDPSICKAGAAVFCSWVPAEVAVRPE